MSEIMKLKVITPERVLFEDDVEKFIVKSNGLVGDFEVLPGHIPFATTIGIGRIIITLPGGTVKQATVFEGFSLTNEDTTTILCQVSEWPEEIDVERAQASKERAEKRVHDPEMDYYRAYASLMRAIERIDICK